MKSLQESLFDNNINKEVTIRQAYCLLAGRSGLEAFGFEVGQMFNVDKLYDYPNPYYPDMFSPGIAGLLGLIVDQEPPTRKDFLVKGQSPWGEELKKKLTKYVKRSWKQEWDKKLEVIIDQFAPNNKIFSIELDFDHGTGVYRFLFKLN